MTVRLKKWLLRWVVRGPIRPWIGRLLAARNRLISQNFLKAQMRTPELRDEYQRLVAGNVAGVLLKIMARFYSDLGVDVHSMPIVKSLESFLQELHVDNLTTPQGQSQPVLIQFERAFALFEAGQVGDALPLFEAVFRNSAARKYARYERYVKEAIVRSGEAFGCYHEKRGDIDSAIRNYREILALDQDGPIARRLALLLSRRGDLREVAELSEVAIDSELNLFPRLPEKNPYIAALEAKFLGK
jgi:tetratricopeptide (TPR) repeat protein